MRGSDAAAVRRALLEAGFTMAGVQALLGGDAFAALGRGRSAPARSALAGAADPPAPLIALFLLGDEVPAQSLPLPVAAAERLGLLERRDRGLARAAVHLQPYPTASGEGFVASDLRRGPMAEDHVTGIGGASITLATITPRDRVGRTLDLGTGCGIEALLAADHSDAVVATDLSDRALRFAALTAALSDRQFDLRSGSLFEPVAGELFDLIVANPPFVMAPAARYTYREAPQRGDDLTRDVVQRAARHLRPGGVAVTLGNWLHRAGEDWRDRVCAWAPEGCQTWIAQRERLSLPQYVEHWLQDSGDLGGAGEQERYGRWLAYLGGLGAAAVGFGWVVLRRAPDAWCVAEDVAEADRLPTGAEVLAQLRHCAQERSASAVRLLAGSPRWAPGVELQRSWPAADPGRDQVHVLASWRPAEEVAPQVQDLMARPGSLADRIEEQTAGDADAAGDLTVRALLDLRRLIGAGMVHLPD